MRDWRQAGLRRSFQPRPGTLRQANLWMLSRTAEAGHRLPLAGSPGLELVFTHLLTCAAAGESGTCFEVAPARKGPAAQRPLVWDRHSAARLQAVHRRHNEF
jgi:hypothetical protein